MLLAVTSLEATNSVFDIIDKNNSFSISITGRWRIPNFLEDRIFDKLRKSLKPKSENGIDLHAKENRKRGSKVKINSTDIFLSEFGTFKKQTLEELNSINYDDLEDLVYRMQLTHDEIMDILGLKNFPSEKIGFTLPPGIHKRSDFNKTLEKFLLYLNIFFNILEDHNKF